MFAVAAGASPDYVALCSLAVMWSAGVDGNLSIDPAVILGVHLRLVPAPLSVSAIRRAFCQLLGSLVRSHVDCLRFRG